MAGRDNGFQWLWLGAFVFLILQGGFVRAQDSDSANNSRIATLAVTDLRDYETQPTVVKKLLAKALELTTRNLAYKYGSDDPKNGTMDCSGTIYYLLNDFGVKSVPRDSYEMYLWVSTKSKFMAVKSTDFDAPEFSAIKPGDLLFWTGTYDVHRDPPVSHVMIYLGVNQHTGRRVMMGASEGRRFNGISRYGVSVFDLELPRPGSTSHFIGYGAVPGLE